MLHNVCIKRQVRVQTQVCRIPMSVTLIIFLLSLIINTLQEQVGIDTKLK